jgi:hypothetical protein
MNNEEYILAEVVDAEAEVVEDLVEPEDPTALKRGYYRVLFDYTNKDYPAKNFEVGDVLYNKEDTPLGKRAEFIWGVEELGFTVTENFHESFEFVDEDALESHFDEVKSQTAKIQLEAQTNVSALQSYSPHVLPSGEVGGTELVRSDSVPIIDAKKGIKLRANEVEKTSLKLASQAGKIAKIVQTKAEIAKYQLERQMSIIKANVEKETALVMRQVENMKLVLARAEEGLWTINLYLGTEEEILLLQEGKHAPAEEPIKVQQLILFMDEECGIVNEKMDGGISTETLDEFDKWLLAKPERIDQIIPFKKGIVALKPRRFEKDYSHRSVTDAVALKKADRMTYFLFRNGENLYYMWTKFDVGDVLIPRRDEFLSHFPGLEHIGDEAYMNAMKKSATMSAHWFRVGLIIQGIIDRTTIFHPIEHKPNILMAQDYGVGVEFVNDAETMLAEGLPNFEEWLAEVNSTLDVGCRIAGEFGDYHWGLKAALREKEEGGGNDRLQPKKAAHPQNGVIYEIESMNRGAYVFKYSREHEYRGWRQAPLTNRGSCMVYPTDDWILNVDSDMVTIDLLNRFLQDRNNRHLYEKMFPIIKQAIVLIEKEAKEESPFREMLATHMNREEPDYASADLLIKWYKFKNKHHRPLVQDDTKAYKMIMEEYPRHLKRNELSPKIEQRHVDFVTYAKANYTNILLVGFVNENEYRVITKANDDNIWVHEHIYYYQKAGPKLYETHEWKPMTNRYWKWKLLDSDQEALADWKKNINVNNFLTDPEKEELALEVVDKYSGGYDNRRIFMIRDDFNGNFETCYWSDSASRRHGDRYLYFASIKYKKSGKAIELETYLRRDSCYSDVEPFKVGEPGKYNHGTKRIYWSDPKVFEEYAQAVAADKLKDEADKKVRELVGKFMHSLRNKRQVEITLAAWTKFANDHGDIELFEGYKKQHPKKFENDFEWGQGKKANDDLQNALWWALESGINVEGMTVKELTSSYPGEPEDEKEDYNFKDYGGGMVSHETRKIGKTIYKKKDDTQEFLMDYVLKIKLEEE